MDAVATTESGAISVGRFSSVASGLRRGWRWLTGSRRGVITTIAIVTALQISPYWFPSEDGTVYLSMAESIHAGESGQALGKSMGLPPVYPAILSLTYYVQDRPFLTISILHCVFATLSAIGIAYWAHRLVGRWWVIVVGITMLGAQYTILHRKTLKECVFLMLLVWTANFLQWGLGSSDRRRRIGHLTVGVCLMSLLVLVRYAGIALLPALFATEIVQRFNAGRSRRTADSDAANLGEDRVATRPVNWRLIGLACVPLLAFIGQAVYQARVSETGTYVGFFVESSRSMLDADRLLESVRMRISDVGRITIPGMFKAYTKPGDWLHVNTLIYLVWFVGLSIGWWRVVRRKPDVLLCAAPVYWAAYVVWNLDQGARFLTPMCPVFAVAIVSITRINFCWMVSLYRRSMKAVAVPRVQRPGVLMSRAFLCWLVSAHLCISVIYYITADRPRARAADASWEDFERIAELTRNEDRPIGANWLTFEQLMILRFTTHRNLPHTPPDQRPVVEGYEWIVQPSGLDVPGEFVVRHRGEHVQLCERLPRPIVSRRPSGVGNR